jgi:hypothetical protein
LRQRAGKLQAFEAMGLFPSGGCEEGGVLPFSAGLALGEVLYFGERQARCMPLKQ